MRSLILALALTIAACTGEPTGPGPVADPVEYTALVGGERHTLRLFPVEHRHKPLEFEVTNGRSIVVNGGEYPLFDFGLWREEDGEICAAFSIPLSQVGEDAYVCGAYESAGSIVDPGIFGWGAVVWDPK